MVNATDIDRDITSNQWLDALTARLYQPILVDAQTARVTDSRSLPWYLTGLLISQPLHFGDYGGMGMKILWALLDIATIVVLGSGVSLWLRRGARTRADASLPALAAPVRSEVMP